ncbi:hypothetical protein M2322_004435 [Rhodoblastus acidophilus]|uniref:hypothetical protein n=1 Tax=Rhodoblastus acidophilus TaxID=1074 RepID=UPI002224B2DD|nr:hypothetical protein [Rhodoblastus acidophilus]MCW2318866.1 hypothetical protein [Rhodoblastus acidophilus]
MIDAQKPSSPLGFGSFAFGVQVCFGSDCSFQAQRLQRLSDVLERSRQSRHVVCLAEFGFCEGQIDLGVFHQKLDVHERYVGRLATILVCSLAAKLSHYGRW